MSIEISVSNKTHTDCSHIINKLIMSGIEARIIETQSTFDNNIEKGCVITLGKEYNNFKKITNLWNMLSSDYSCAHLKINQEFSGRIHDYICINKKSNRPHNL